MIQPPQQSSQAGQGHLRTRARLQQEDPAQDRLNVFFLHITIPAPYIELSKETSTIIPSVRHSTRERRPLLGSQVPNQSIITARIKLAAKANIQTYIYATSIHVAQTKTGHDERSSSCELHIRYTNAFLDRTGPQPGTHQSLNPAPSRLWEGSKAMVDANGTTLPFTWNGLLSSFALDHTHQKISVALRITYCSISGMRAF